MTRSERRKEWESRIANLRKSGLTHSKWCELNDVNFHQLKYWLRQLRSENVSSEPSSKWLPVTIDDSKITIQESLHIEVNQVKIEVKTGFHPALLAEVVRTLRNL
jgi:transposase-like protein